jgi:hypothetical protein
MNLDLAAIDDSLLARIKDQVNGFRTLESLDYEEQILEPGSKPLPACYTFVNGAAYESEQGNTGYQEGDVAITIFIKTKNLRGKGAARKADNGAYAMTTKTADALLGYSPTACAPLQLASIEAVRVTKTEAIFAVSFTAPTSEDF